MNQKDVFRAAIRTLRAGIILKHPPGDKRGHLLARLEVIIEQSAVIRVFVAGSR